MDLALSLPRVQSLIRELRSHKLGDAAKKKEKLLCTGKEIINKMKRQPTEWEKIFANRTYDTGLISKIYKELITAKKPPSNLI